MKTTLTILTALLFGKNPQRFLPTSEVKRLHFHGTEIRKPIPSDQIYKGTVFDLVDRAVDFVRSKIARAAPTATLCLYDRSVANQWNNTVAGQQISFSIESYGTRMLVENTATSRARDWEWYR